MGDVQRKHVQSGGGSCDGFSGSGSGRSSGGGRSESCCGCGGRSGSCCGCGGPVVVLLVVVVGSEKNRGQRSVSNQTLAHKREIT